MTTLTQQVIERVRAMPALDADTVAAAKHCILDTLGVAIAGSTESVAVRARRFAASEGGAPHATVWGTALRVSRGQAALLNGTAAHALDFDDVVPAMEGHPSVPVLPAVLAIAEGTAASGRDLIRAFVAGFETEALVGLLMKPSHYARGFHTTATVGAFGAAAASAELLGLDGPEWEHAFGVAGAHASGLKSMFGTMTKPLQVGSASENGLRAALLAQAGVTADRDVLGTEQGFRLTQSDGAGVLPSRAGSRLHISDVLFKYHAACYLTHSTIAGLLPMRRDGVRPRDIVSIDLQVPPGHLSVCNIEDPQSALEAKFSVKFAAAAALVTGDLSERGFTEVVRMDPQLRALMKQVHVAARSGPERSTIVTVHLADGGVRTVEADVNAPTPPERFPERWEALVGKFRSLSTPVLGAVQVEEIIGHVANLDAASSAGPLIASLRAGEPRPD